MLKRQCDLEEFEDLAHEYIVLCENISINNELLGGQLMTLNATVALQTQEIIRLESKLKSRKLH